MPVNRGEVISHSTFVIFSEAPRDAQEDLKGTFEYQVDSRAWLQERADLHNFNSLHWWQRRLLGKQTETIDLIAALCFD